MTRALLFAVAGAVLMFAAVFFVFWWDTIATREQRGWVILAVSLLIGACGGLFFEALTR